MLGNVDEGITNTVVRDEFKCCNVYAKDKCRNVLPSSIVAAAVLPMPTISAGISTAPTTSVVNYRRNVWNAPL